MPTRAAALLVAFSLLGSSSAAEASPRGRGNAAANARAQPQATAKVVRTAAWRTAQRDKGVHPVATHVAAERVFRAAAPKQAARKLKADPFKGAANALARGVVDAAREHLTLGMPSKATPESKKARLLVRRDHVISYNGEHRGPNWVAWKTTAADIGPVERQNNFRADPTVPPKERAHLTDFKGWGKIYHRGHMLPSGERSANDRANDRTFPLANVLPQHKLNNTGSWNTFEIWYRDRVAKGEVDAHVIAGGIYKENPTTLKHEGRVGIPSYTWKVLVLTPPGVSPAKAGRNAEVYAILVPNFDKVGNKRVLSLADTFEKHIVPVSQIEQKTGYKFFEQLPTALAQEFRERNVVPQVERHVFRDWKVKELQTLGIPMPANAVAANDI